MQQLDRRGRGIGGRRIVVAAGPRHGEAQAWADAVASGEHRVTDGFRQSGRSAGRLRMGDGSIQGLLDPAIGIHQGHSHCLLVLPFQSVR